MLIFRILEIIKLHGTYSAHMSAVPFIQFRVLIPVIVSLDYNPPDLRYRNLLNKPESDLVEGLVKTFSTSLLDITECFLITNRFETSKDA